MLHKKIKQTFISIIVSTIILSVGCSNNTNGTEPAENNSDNYFFNKNIGYWKMKKSNSNDTAYFEALPETNISLAMNFWDTTISSRISTISTPLRFVYWENGMKKQQYFAIVRHNNKLFFGIQKHQLLSNYNLDFYIYLFEIPDKTPISNEFNSAEFPVGTLTWKLNYSTEWQQNKEDVYVAKYTAYNSMAVPQTYIEEFGFIKDFGFFSYMGYELII